MKPERLTIRDWGRDIHDLCGLISDLKTAPALIVEASVEDLGDSFLELGNIINDALARIRRRQ